MAYDTQCLYCKHLIEWPYCFAFMSAPGIPEEIRRGEFDHNLPFPGDNGIRFTPLEAPYDLSEEAIKRILIANRGRSILPDTREISLDSLEDALDDALKDSDPAPLELLQYPESDTPPPDLLAAASSGDVNAVTLALDMGVDVNTADERGNTALMVACRNCQIEVARLLIARGADVHARNSYSRTALDIAADWGYPSITRLLRKHGATEQPDAIRF